MLIWVKEKHTSGGVTASGWKVNSIEHAIQFVKNQFRTTWHELVFWVTEDDGEIVVSKSKFKRMLKKSFVKKGLH